jgi:integrase/recombinase XerC
VRTFCTYLTDPAYGWMADCWARFGSYPIHVCHEWNTAAHVQDAEADAGKRAFTREELQVTPARPHRHVRRERRPPQGRGDGGE